MSPRRLFRIVAIAEAITWAMLLTGMFLKYVTETTELGVRIGGMIHGVVFIAYCLVTVLVGIDAKWSIKRIALGLASAIPPFFTIWFDLAMEKRGALAETWRLATPPPQNLVERLSVWLITKPLQGLGAGVVAVAALTGVALLLGPPVG